MKLYFHFPYIFMVRYLVKQGYVFMAWYLVKSLSNGDSSVVVVVVVIIIIIIIIIIAGLNSRAD